MTINPTQLAFLPQHDDRALKDWLREHGLWHSVVDQNLIQQNITFGLPHRSWMDMADTDDWLYFHNVKHQDNAQALNIEAPDDLTYWDFDDPINWNAWLSAHSRAHLNEQKALNIT